MHLLTHEVMVITKLCNVKLRRKRITIILLLVVLYPVGYNSVTVGEEQSREITEAAESRFYKKEEMGEIRFCHVLHFAYH